MSASRFRVVPCVQPFWPRRPARARGCCSGDPREALLRELATPGGARLEDAALSGAPQILQAVYADELRRKMERERADAAKIAALGMPAPNVAALICSRSHAAAGAERRDGGGDGGAPTMTPEPPPEQKFFRADAQARLERACAAPIGFVERLVAFWSNHFCVSVAKSNIGRAAAGAFEREAIRPHVLGRFADMLRAVEQHPAMLNFLDNAQSVGPNSMAGQNRKAGLNENLAREILELHTMGVGSGYTPGRRHAARLHSDRLDDRRPRGQARRTRDLRLQRQRARAAGRDRCSAASICRRASRKARRRSPISRARARRRTHIARKFARHFVADSPDPGLRAARLAEVFRETDGDLGALARALVADEAAWSAPATKIRNPWELTVAAYRAFAR